MSHPCLLPPPESSACASPALDDTAGGRNRRLRLLVAAAGPRDTSWAQALVVRLSKDPQIEMRAVVDDAVPRLMQTVTVLENRNLSRGGADDAEFYRQQACELVEWADVMVCVPLDADGMAKMVAGIADTLLGEVLRGWNAERRIVLVPGMSTDMWANPTTKRQLGQLGRRWDWVRVMAPILWHYEGQPSNPRRVPSWNGFDEVLGIVKNQADLLGLGHDVETATAVVGSSNGRAGGRVTKLPPEIWTAVLDVAGDWELAQALGIHTSLPMPAPWRLEPRDPSDGLGVYEHELEWTVLKCDATAVCKKLSQSPPDLHDLPALVVRLVVKFALVEVLQYLEANRPDLFRAFHGTLLPTQASAYYPRIDVLDYWRHGSRWFRNRHAYDSEAVDGASTNGHVRVLDWWWRQSGLPLRYTEVALEQASCRGQLPVLDWWRDAAAQDEGIVLRPGRSLLWAAQQGRTEVLRWWKSSGIPVGHGQRVARMASDCGRVKVLETWRQLQGDGKVVLDAEALVSATRQGHVDVLEWWRRFAHGELEGMDGRRQRVEFRAGDMVAALEDAGSKTRRWWAQYGLAPRLPQEQWFQTKHL